MPLVARWRLLVPCLADPLPPATSSQLHRLIGVQDYNAGNAANAAPATANAGAYKDKKAPEPKVGTIAFDGTTTRERPADRNTVVQLLNPMNQVTQTAYLLPEQPLPTYAAVPHLQNSLLITAVATLAGSAACYGGAWAAHGQFMAADSTYTLDDLESYKGTTNALFAASVTLGAVALGTGTGALVVGAR